MAIEDVLVQKIFDLTEANAHRQGKEDCLRELTDKFMQMIQLAVPVVTALIQADSQPSAYERNEEVRRTVQSELDKRDARLEALFKETLKAALANAKAGIE